eukprot:1805520-Pyramimonas_sp.AAC.1
MSGFLFAISTTPFAADNIGGALKALRVLWFVARIMSIAEHVACLILKPSKCNITPVFAAFSDAVRELVQSQLAVLVPQWSQLQIIDGLKYLGLWLGPAADDLCQFRAPAAKVVTRSLALGRSSAPASALAFHHASRCISCLSYVSQLVPLPKQLRSKELGVLVSTFRLPLGALQQAQFLRVRDWGGPRT